MNSEDAEPKSMLVVGDVCIDRSWILGAQTWLSTSQSHYGVAPEKIAEPCRKTEILGGAATIARSVCCLAPQCNVYLVGAWDEKLIEAEMIPEEEPSGQPIHRRIRFLRGADSPFTKEINRIYRSESGKTELTHRYDRDVPKTALKALPIEWPDPNTIDAIIVGDYDKGLLDLREIVDALQRYNGKPFLLRSKRRMQAELFRQLPWTCICPNRQDLAYFVSAEYMPTTAIRDIGGKRSIHPLLLSNLEKARGICKSGQSIVIKLDREGALLLEGNNLLVVSVAPSCQGPYSAGSVLI
jgi:bifunctional ADP-heptose synthase (sugar kinase/adenylyltransferase)